MNRKLTTRILASALTIGMVVAIVTSIGGFYREFDISNTTGLSIETAGSGESAVVIDDSWLMTVGGYPSSTHFARLRYKLPERAGIILTTFYMRLSLSFHLIFTIIRKVDSRIINTDNYGTELGGIPVGTPGSAEFRTGVYIHKDHSLTIRSDHDHVCKGFLPICHSPASW
jgi:hypothetical protein